jgi:hypothetical protein
MYNGVKAMIQKEREIKPKKEKPAKEDIPIVVPEQVL